MASRVPQWTENGRSSSIRADGGTRACAPFRAFVDCCLIAEATGAPGKNLGCFRHQRSVIERFLLFGRVEYAMEDVRSG